MAIGIIAPLATISRRVGWLEGRKLVLLGYWSSSPPIERAVAFHFSNDSHPVFAWLRDRFSTGISFPFELGSNEAQAHAAGD
jgi:hypothetical protein